jgi:serine/threonine-protein kinase HipA
MKHGYKEIYVYADWEFLENTQLMGILYSEILRGKEKVSFEYDENWLDSNHALLLDPDLGLYPGRQYIGEENEKSNFGIFMDSSPDRWGRLLMKRREAVLARIEKRNPKNFFETDYLLGVYDEHRMGAMRFKLDESGPFINDEEEMATPPFTSIRELQEISLKLESDISIDDTDYLKWLNLILAPGSSLGGARPKADVVFPDGSLWIAKFPSKNDDSDAGAWEMLASELAVRCGINAATSEVRVITGRHHTFFSKRFDRLPTGRRRHFASAMSMLGYTDSHKNKEEASYLELAEFISNNGANVNEDLEELWRRIVFNILISNTDDHLRNHGFLLTPSGWILSPAYDLNPNETGTGLSLSISETDNSLSTDLAMEVREYFRIKENKAREIIEKMRDEVKNWRKIADRLKISKADQQFKERAFKN